MGHLRQLKASYRALADRLKIGTCAFPEPEDEAAWEGWRTILELLFPADEALLLARMPVVPLPLGRLAERFGVPEPELGPRLDALCDRGVVLDMIDPDTGQRSYLLAPPVVGFVEFSMMRARDDVSQKRIAQALEAYMAGADDTFAREVFDRATPIGRALTRDEEESEILDWERATALVDGASALSVSLCYCRHKAAHLGKACKAPQDNCLSLNLGAAFVVRHGFGRAIQRAEAQDILAAARAQGLVQIADNVKSEPSFLCNCCGCCCAQLTSISRFHLPAVVPSGFVACVVTDKCAGCSRCARACPIAAITMDATRVPARSQTNLLAKVDAGVCIGCGICAGVCKKGAMTMDRRPVRRHVPDDVYERSIRMALERNMLAHLFFDEASGRGPRVMNRLVQALTRLPPLKQILAAEQLQSRFVRQAMKRIGVVR
jgi:ferredoxin